MKNANEGRSLFHFAFFILHSMNYMICAIVPVKPLQIAKTRLSDLLTISERGMLVLAMFDDVLAALGAARGIERIGVVSADRTVLARAAALGAEHPSTVDAREALAEELVDAGDPSRGEALLRQVVASLAPRPEESPYVLADALFALARRRSAVGDLADALALAGQALPHAPERPPHGRPGRQEIAAWLAEHDPAAATARRPAAL